MPQKESKIDAKLEEEFKNYMAAHHEFIYEYARFTKKDIKGASVKTRAALMASRNSINVLRGLIQDRVKYM